MDTHHLHVNEITAWSWIAGVVLLVLVLMSVFTLSANRYEVAQNTDMAVPPIEQTAPPVVPLLPSPSGERL